MFDPNKYVVERNPNRGDFLCVKLAADQSVVAADDPEFLEWNKQRNPPLSVEKLVFPAGHVVCSDVTTVIREARDRGITLFVQHPVEWHANVNCHTNVIYNDAQGLIYNLSQAIKGSKEAGDGIVGGPSPIWVPEVLYQEPLRLALHDKQSELRKVTSWTVQRTFVYLDISDFSKFPPGQEALVINSLVRIVQDWRLWNSGYASQVHRLDKPMLCIGDGYIFVFENPLDGAFFAGYLAELIEALVAHQRLPVDFHFRMGVHVGEVYTFWDPGRRDWNYIGDGINGGNRVLAAVGKEQDDVVFISGQVRKAIYPMKQNTSLADAVLNCLTNRGRKKDKHDSFWRVYELNHTALCGNMVPGEFRTGG